MLCRNLQVKSPFSSVKKTTVKEPFDMINYVQKVVHGG